MGGGIYMDNEVTLRVSVPQPILDQYEEQATQLGVPVEDILSVRLQNCVTLNDNRPIYFTDDQRRELDSLMGKNLRDAADLIKWVRKVLSVRVNDGQKTHIIALKPTLVQRLKTRCFGKPFPAFLKDTTIIELERFVGLR
jgi:hypothetical protein